MTRSADPPGFEKWLEDITSNPDTADDPGEVSAANRRWLRRFFDANGAVPREMANRAFLSDQVALADEAVTAVLGDLHNTTSLRPRVLVDVWMDHGIRITIDDGYTAPSMWSVERPEAFAEVADYFQEQLASELGSWPVCERHDLGLHAEVHEGTAVWWCRRFQHAVAHVGDLRVPQPRARRRKSRRR